jgi:hypothetical protein
MNCTAPRLFRHRTTLQYWISGCMRWTCQGCIRKIARRWRAMLNWAGKHGPAPEYFLTLTTREPLPLWREAPAEPREEQYAKAVALKNLPTFVERF